MIDKTQAMDRLIAQDADLIDLPAMTDVETIAEGLTENMRLALSYAKWANDGSWWIKYSDTNRTTHSLRKRGIVERDSNGK
jgi:hypothetical protein